MKHIWTNELQYVDADDYISCGNCMTMECESIDNETMCNEV